MKINFTDHNDFDKYAREQDGWSYDNGWQYQGEHFSAYAFSVEKFGTIKSGIQVEYIVLLRDDQFPNKTILLQGKHKQLHEIWSGFIRSQGDYQKMMAILNKFIEEYKSNSGAT